MLQILGGRRLLHLASATLEERPDALSSCRPFGSFPSEYCICPAAWDNSSDSEHDVSLAAGQLPDF